MAPAAALGAQERTLLAALALCVCAALALLVWKLQRPGASARASLQAASLVARHAEQRAGTTLIEVFSGAPDKAAKGTGSVFDNWMNTIVYYEPFRRFPFTPALTCEPGYSVLMNRFDWQFVPNHAYVRDLTGRGKANPKELTGCRSLDNMPIRSNNHTSTPRTVWAAAHALQELLEAAEAAGLQRGREDRVVVFFGNEMPLSKAFGRNRAEWTATVDRLRRYFGTIAYQVKDVQLEHVRLAPMGLCWGYLMMVVSQWISNTTADRRTVRKMAEHFHAFDYAIGVDLRVKDRGVLAVSGYVAGWLDNATATRERAAMLEMQGKLYPPSNSSLHLVVAAVNSRERMREWLVSPAAKAVGVNWTFMPATSWWTELARYRFLISPMGSAIQTSKTVEALVVLTLPIVQRMAYHTHDELVEMGFPIVVVDSWEDITPNATERWWAELSPRLEGFRRNCLTVEGYWRMFTGRTKRCS